MRYLLKFAGISAAVICLSVSGFLKARLKKEEIKRLKAVFGAFCRAGDMLTLSNTDRRAIINECFSDLLKDGKTGKANEIINSFFEGFGSGDTVIELNRIERAKRKTEELISKEEREYAAFSKIWRTTGICAGLAAGIIFI